MGVKTKEKDALIILQKLEKDFGEEIELSFKLENVYVDKISAEIINTKVSNQMNSMKVSIDKINPKFCEKAKNYEKVKEQMTDVLSQYEEVLKQYCKKYDNKIKSLIQKKFDSEKELLEIIKKLKDKQESEKNQKLIKSVMNKLRKKVTAKEDTEEQEMEYKEEIRKRQAQIRSLNNKIHLLNDQKAGKLFEAMEVGNKQLVVEIKKPRRLKKVTRFFVNRFNTYKVITQTVIGPMEQRIDEFKANKLGD